MDAVTIIGFVAAVLTTVAGVPQFIKTVRTKHTHSLSLYTYILLVFGISLWLIYGILIKDMPLIFSNTVTLVPVAIILALKIKNG